MDYWAETMQDDAYLIAEDGWKATPYRVLETRKNRTAHRARRWTKAGPATWCPSRCWCSTTLPPSKPSWTGWPPSWKAHWPPDQAGRRAQRGRCGVRRLRQDQRHKEVKSRIREIRRDDADAAEKAVLKRWLALSGTDQRPEEAHEVAGRRAGCQGPARYPTLTPDEVKALVVDPSGWRHWMRPCMASWTA